MHAGTDQQQKWEAEFLSALERSSLPVEDSAAVETVPEAERSERTDEGRERFQRSVVNLIQASSDLGHAIAGRVKSPTKPAPVQPTATAVESVTAEDVRVPAEEEPPSAESAVSPERPLLGEIWLGHLTSQNDRSSSRYLPSTR